MVEDSPEFYPDEYFVGFDGSKLAGDGYTALAHRNADGTVQVITVDGFPGPDGEELYASHGYRLHGWDALTLRIWAAQREALAVFDRLEDYWGPWIAALPTDGLFDWMGWRPWEMMRAWIVPPDPFLQQIPRTFGLQGAGNAFEIGAYPWIPGLDCSLGVNGALIFDTGVPSEDRSRWHLPDYSFGQNVVTDPVFADQGEESPPYPPLTDAQSRWVTDVGPMSNDTFRKLLADSIVEMPAKTWHPEPTHLEVAPYQPDQGEELPPDTNHGGDRHPGRYA